MKNHVIFDLDGTLINSAPSILKSFAIAFKKLNVDPVIPITENLIGPPLLETLSLLAGTKEKPLLNNLANEFKLQYDTQGYKETIAYPEIGILLKSLNESGFKLYIATNKRYEPTLKIIDFLEWESYFANIYALDYFKPSAPSKAAMLTNILASLNLNPEACIYIGDRTEDGVAALESKLDFVLVKWGYYQQDNEKDKKYDECSSVQVLKRKILSLL